MPQTGWAAGQGDVGVWGRSPSATRWSGLANVVFMRCWRSVRQPIKSALATGTELPQRGDREGQHLSAEAQRFGSCVEDKTGFEPAAEAA
jgi:hypothetical protein